MPALQAVATASWWRADADYLSSWEWECCGDTFRVGSTVHWKIERTRGIDDHLVTVLGPQWRGRVLYSEGHHDLIQDGLHVSGTVRSIDVLTTDHDVVNRTLVPIPSGGRLSRVGEMGAWAPGLNHTPHGRMLDGWIVSLELEAEPTPLMTAQPAETD